MSITFDPFAAGTRTAFVSIVDDATDSPQTVSLSGTGTTQSTGALAVSPGALSFSALKGSTPSPLALSITNTGSGILAWTAYKSQSWLTLDIVSGTTPTSIHASVSVSGLYPGIYNDTITVAATAAPNSPVQIPVELIVTPQGGYAVFTDGFEGPRINPFWSSTTQFGSIGLSTDHVHRGKQSAKFTSTDGGNRLITLSHAFPAPIGGDFSIWFYDAAPGQNTLYEQLQLTNSITSVSASVGTMDFDPSCYEAYLIDNKTNIEQGPNATCGPYPQTSTTNVTRTLGWHKLDINVAPSSMSISIDGETVFSTPKSQTFDALTISVAGPAYDADTEAYYDDFTYTPLVTAAPTLHPNGGGTFTSPQNVTITDTTPGATVYYALHGAIPNTSSTPYTGPIPVNTTTTIRAIAVAPGYSTSALAVGTFTIARPAPTPIFTPATGTYTGSTTVKITDTAPGAVIYYALHGATPTIASTKYTGPITVSSTTTVKAIATAANYSTSAVASATYTLNLPKSTATPIIGPAAGSYGTAKTITITDATSGAMIYYTLNGSTPSTSSTKYTAAFKISASATVNAIAVASGYTQSAVATSAYIITLPTATPTISPAAGTYATAKTITLADTTTGAVIYYTLDGTTPTTASKQYTAAFKITATTTVKAIALAPGHSTSTLATSTFTIN